MGTIDGSTPYGDVIDVGSVTNFIVGGVTNSPTVAADTNRYSLDDQQLDARILHHHFKAGRSWFLRGQRHQ